MAEAPIRDTLLKSRLTLQRRYPHKLSSQRETLICAPAVPEHQDGFSRDCVIPSPAIEKKGAKLGMHLLCSVVTF